MSKSQTSVPAGAAATRDPRHSGNAASLERLPLDGFGKGDLTVLDEVVAANFVEHQPGLPQGREGLKQVIRSLHQSFPDLNYSVVHMVDDGDKVWGHFRGRGTNTGPFMGQAPTGKPMDINVIDIARFEDGIMVEHSLSSRHKSAPNHRPRIVPSQSVPNARSGPHIDDKSMTSSAAAAKRAM